MFIPAVLSDITSRSMSSLIDKFSTAPIAAATLEDILSSLERFLIIEEAEQRHVTNQAMLRQLNQMKGPKEMYRGYHTLDDIFRCRDHQVQTAKDQSQAVVVSSSNLHRLNYFLIFVTKYVNY
jgi:hypothetical protein